MAGANAEYVINVATTFEGEQTIAQLDTLTGKLLSGGANADSFHDAIAKVTNQLTAAKSATAAANAALAEGSDHYAALEKAANSASTAFEKAQKTGVVPPGVEASHIAATAAVNDQAKALKALEDAATKAAADETKLGATLKNVKQLQTGAAGATDTHEISTRKLSRGLSELGGPLGQLGRTVLTPIRGFQALSEELGGNNALMAVAAIGTVALVAAMVAVAAATVYATVRIAAWAVGLADANRSVDLHEQALSKLNPRYAAVSRDLFGLTDSTGETREQLDGLTKALVAAHVSVQNMPAALQAAAIAEAALGNGGAQQFIDKLAAGTLSVKRFAAQTQASFGGIVQKQMMGLTAQSARFHDNIAGLFGGLDIDPALKGLQRLVALFDENTAAGSAIKVLFTGVFQPLINSADKASVVIEAFVLGFLIGLTKLYIQAKPAIKAISAFLGFHDPSTADSLDTISAVAEKAAPVILFLGAAFTAVVAVVGLAVGVLALGAAMLLALPVAALAAAVAIGVVFVNAWHSVTDFLGSIDLAKTGTNIVMGLIEGITGAGPAVLKALGGVVTDAIDGAKHRLGIHSPSTVFAEIGHNTGAGMARGLDASAAEVQTAMTSVVEPPDPSPATAPSRAGSPTSAKGPSSTVSKSPDLSGAVFNFYGVKDAASAKESFGEMLTAFLEGDAAKLGNAKAATP